MRRRASCADDAASAIVIEDRVNHKQDRRMRSAWHTYGSPARLTWKRIGQADRKRIAEHAPGQFERYAMLFQIGFGLGRIPNPVQAIPPKA